MVSKGFDQGLPTTQLPRAILVRGHSAVIVAESQPGLGQVCTPHHSEPMLMPSALGLAAGGGWGVWRLIWSMLRAQEPEGCLNLCGVTP